MHHFRKDRRQIRSCTCSYVTFTLVLISLSYHYNWLATKTLTRSPEQSTTSPKTRIKVKTTNLSFDCYAFVVFKTQKCKTSITENNLVQI